MNVLEYLVDHRFSAFVKRLAGTVRRDFIHFTLREEVLPLDRRSDTHACGPKVRRLLQIRADAFKFFAPHPAAVLMIPWRFAIVFDGLRPPEATMEFRSFGTGCGCQAEEAYDRRYWADGFVRVIGVCRLLDTY